MRGYFFGSIKEVIASIQNSKIFQGFFEGVELCTPDGEILSVRILETSKALRPDGLRFSKYSYETTAELNGHSGYGYGEAETELLAIQKSIAEAIERAVFKYHFKTVGTQKNSNGWAAHLTPEKARHSALNELLERDAVLTHWLTKTPFTEINPETFPKGIREWRLKKQRMTHSHFPILKAGVTTLGRLPVVSTILMNSSGNGVISHAVAPTLDAAFEKALIETCRIGEIALNANEETTDLIAAHVLQYAKKEPLPVWLLQNQTVWKQVSRDWKEKFNSFDAENFPHTFHVIASGPITVGYCTSPEIQNLFFGSTDKAAANGLINWDRINQVTKGRVINTALHCVA